MPTNIYLDFAIYVLGSTTLLGIASPIVSKHFLLIHLKVSDTF